MDILCGNCGRHYATVEEVQHCACKQPDKIEMKRQSEERIAKIVKEIVDSKKVK